MTRPRLVLTALGLVVTGMSCADEAAECVSNDVGAVCAEAKDGAINFRGDGLLPGPTVELGEAVVGPITYTVDGDGSFDPGASSGVMAVFSGTELTFDVAATDADGDLLTGRIRISTG